MSPTLTMFSAVEDDRALAVDRGEKAVLAAKRVRSSTLRNMVWDFRIHP